MAPSPSKSSLVPFVTALVFVSACGQAQTRSGDDVDVFPVTTAGGAGSTGADADPEGSSGGEMPLDLGSSNDPAPECASISQSTTIEELPSDIIMVAVGDPASAAQDFRDEAGNLLPYIPHVGITDANVVFVVGGTPPLAPDRYPNCTGWVCCDQGDCTPDFTESFPPFAVVDHIIDPARPLSDLLATRDAWEPLLRPGARKHIWFISPSVEDDTTDATSFSSQFEGLGMQFEGFSAHAAVWGDGEVLNGPLRDLVDETGGLYHDHTMGNYDAEAFFDAALAQVKTSSLLCAYNIPEAPQGHTFHKMKVNVEYDEGGGIETIGYVPSLSECSSVADGWYYDDETAPSELVMCPETCERFQRANEATIDIRFGCDTVPAG